MSEIRKITADKIYTGIGEALTNHMIVVNSEGFVLDLLPVLDSTSTSGDFERFRGILVPGFVNAHCHLELSHMKQMVPTGTGLILFIKDVVTKRGIDPQVIVEAIESADLEMRANGIVAVGDISNVTDSFQVKKESPIHYHTFVEMFDFLQNDQAETHYQNYLKTYRKLVDDYALPGTAVPHAPYSVSEKLFKMLWELNEDNSQALISIHNMETPAENELFLSNSGELITFYEEFGIPTHHLKPTNQSSIHYALQNMDPRKPTLFVHNTLCQRSEIRAAMEWNPQSYWVTCPSANLYIENRLPRYKEFLDEKATVAIGTDSLTSNWGLSILEEMKVIAKFQSFIPFEVLLQWGTYNGALALGLSDKLGSIEIGKRPGINLLYSEDGSEPESLSGEVKVRKLV